MSEPVECVNSSAAGFSDGALEVTRLDAQARARRARNGFWRRLDRFTRTTISEPVGDGELRRAPAGGLDIGAAEAAGAAREGIEREVM